MIIRALLVLILFLGSASPGFTEAITLGAENDWAPYAEPLTVPVWPTTSYRLPTKAVGIDVAFKVGPYNRLLKEVREGAILGAFNVPKESANEKDYIFGSTPLFVAHSALLS